MSETKQTKEKEAPNLQIMQEAGLDSLHSLLFLEAGFGEEISSGLIFVSALS